MAGYLYLNKLYLVHYRGICNDSRWINIVCLGESSTAGLWVSPQDSYPKQLENKLRKFYGNQSINIIIPPHVGQNTSQVYNRINQYIKLYQPKLIILMVGANNEWSLSESSIIKFLKNTDKEVLKVKLLIALNNFRLFKMLRYLCLKFFIKDNSEYIQQNRYSVLGHPELVRFPPEKWIYAFANLHRKAFIEMWKYDVSNIIQASKKNKVKVLLLTYHINPDYLPVEEYISLAEREEVLLVRNDKSFEQLLKNGGIKRYLLHDNWHPNKEGYTIIADSAFQYIKDYDLLR